MYVHPINCIAWLDTSVLSSCLPRTCEQHVFVQVILQERWICEITGSQNKLLDQCVAATVLCMRLHQT